MNNRPKFPKSWLPNSLTLGNLILGFFAIVISLSSPEKLQLSQSNPLLLAGLLIGLAAALDGMDGPLARKLGTASKTGAHLDSLADLTTFGLAPAALMYAFRLNEIHYSLHLGSNFQFNLPAGLMLVALYPASAAYRLARFNAEEKKINFNGLPSPMAGLTIAFLPLLESQGVYLSNTLYIAFVLALSFLMVSRIPYDKPVSSASSGKYLFSWLLLFAIVLFVAFALKWYWLLCSMIATYIFSGVVTFLFSLPERFKTLSTVKKDEKTGI